MASSVVTLFPDWERAAVRVSSGFQNRASPYSSDGVSTVVRIPQQAFRNSAAIRPA